MKLNEKNTKLHYKMYKSGKKWLISGITTAVLAITVSDFASINQASADAQVSNQDNTNNINKNNSSTTSSSSNAQSSSADSSKATTSSSSNAQSSSADSSKATTSSSSNAQSSTVDSSKATASSSSDAQSSSVENSKSSNGSQSSDGNSSSDSNEDGISNKMLDSSNDTIKSLPSGGSYVTTDGGKTYKYVYQNAPIKGLYEDNGKIVYFDGYDGTQARGVVYNIDNSNYIFDKNSGDGTKINEISGGQYRQATANDGQSAQVDSWVYQQSDSDLAKGIESVDGNLRYFDTTTGSQLKGGTAEIAGANYYFEPSQGDLIGNVDQIVNNGKYVNNGADQYVDVNNNPVKGLISVNNSLQYFDNNGNQVKNQQVITNGATYYFDDSGNGQYLFTNTGNSVSTDTSQHNVANSADPNDYKNTVDGFLTADSWYRPKDILDGGTNWRASNSSDYRPIITTWWPNKDIQVNYLKLMQDNGLLSNDVQYNRFSDQTTLDQAAQTAQIGIEQKIKQENSTDWLNNLLFKGSTDNPSFMNKQFVWNVSSEYPGRGDAWFQGGYLKYGNNSLTPNTNSNYRYADNSFDFLLANDIDNSNPVVQAEDLNWLYYMMNFGTITTGGIANDANFDSVRLDAVDFISNDSIQRTYDYLNDAYKLSQSEINANKHISLVEAGVDAGTTTYNSNGLIEANFRELARLSLINGPGKNSSLSNLIKDSDSNVVIADHSNYSSDSGVPNYSIIHAHDKGIQENVGEAITDVTGADWTNFTDEQLKEGLAAYYNDQRSSNKKYNSYNLPSAYAIMLTNKGTVPRIYYGDMYQDDGQYMQNQSIYYDAISSLMDARKQYVAGGQTMSVDDNGLLKSVRFGKNAMTSDDTGTPETRTEGIGLIVGNDPSINLKDNDTVTLNMGAAHKNQAYRALMLTTKDGIQTYGSDNGAPTAYTDNNGLLTFSNKNINDQANTRIAGTLNPQVSGYLAAWVPVGASTDQDARTASSTTENTDGKVLHSNDALDSNLIYEGFSNFQPIPTSHDEMTNVVIAKNADLFKNWGVTSFEMAPQYKSSDDNSFLDSTVKNGYAFSDRYDLGFDTPTKYGTDEDLRQAIMALHQSGMQVMADLVLNQVYNLPGKEVVSAGRAGVYGNDVQLPFGNQLYVTNTIGGGKYQQKYGGEFLNEIQKEYPDLFNGKNYDYYLKNYSDNGSGPAYLSTLTGHRSEISSDEKLKQWSAKYMNGTNILGRGMGYVLKDWNNGTYFKLNGQNTVLPPILSSSLIYQNGWTENSDKSWSYYDENSGSRLLGNQVINGQHVFFNTNGIQVKGNWGENPDGTWSYYDQNSGERFTGLHEINGQHVYFNDNGVQSKGQITNVNGKLMYFDANSGNLVTNTKLTINGVNYDADSDGVLSIQDDSSSLASSKAASEAASASASTEASLASSKAASEAASASASTEASLASSKAASEAASASASTEASLASSKASSEAASASASTEASLASSKASSEAASASASTEASLASSKASSEAASASASTEASLASSKASSEAASASASTEASLSSSKAASEAASASASTEASLASSKAASEAASASASTEASLASSKASSEAASSSSSVSSSGSSSSNINSVSSSVNSSNSASSSTSTNNSVTSTVFTNSTSTGTISTGTDYYVTGSTTSSSDSSATSSVSTSTTNSSSATSNASSSNSSLSSSSTTDSESSSATSSISASSVNSFSTAKAAFDKSMKLYKAAEKQKQQNHSNQNVANFNKAAANYYSAEKHYLKIAKLYNSKYYYDFDKVTKYSKYVKLNKLAFVYDSKKFAKQNRIHKLKKGTKIKVDKIVRHGKTTRFNIGHNKFITGLKSFIHKLTK